MKEKIKKFLKDNDLLPLSRWNYFEIVHGGISPTDIQKEADYLKIRNHVLGKSGLYVYEKDKKVIYVGKAKSLFGRIKNHYVSSHKEAADDTKNKLRHRFFSSRRNLGKLKIYWKEQEGEEIRKIIEKMMDYVLEPEFNNFREKYKNS